ncbi:DUF998 domain-containing protein [Actinocrispum wychmicini]|uniref:Uncharacterized protein DUF998 n=1 Tax=Actinocrispum wychmicini TaxID=1213861 RepID=A0A4R2JP17_9PSEU|nr:DUF998 domain-containing protein [Actinocrispum wychmicini]TCO60492.1 uncharacterized protein DUF998 [Actinocrispum wychmicini]
MTTSQVHPHAATLAKLAVATAVGAFAVVGALTIALGRQVDPLTDPVSDYALHGSGAWLFAVAVGLLVLGGVAIGAAMVRAGLPRAAAPRVWFGLWCTGLTICAVFPGNPSSTETTWAGEVHRFGGALFLTSMPLACLSLARRLGSHPLWTVVAARARWFAYLGGATAGAFGVSQVVPWLPQGLLERGALGVELAFLVVLATTVSRAVR